MCECESTMPGVRYLPWASMTVAAAGRVDGFADGGDLAVLDIDGAVFNVAVGDGHDGGVLDDDVVSEAWIARRTLAPERSGTRRRAQVFFRT